jgi:hypothetical protein
MCFAKAGGRAGSALADLSGIGLFLLVSLWFQFAHGFIVLLYLVAAGVFHFPAPILVLVKTLFVMRQEENLFLFLLADRATPTLFLAAVPIPVSIAQFGPVVILVLFWCYRCYFFGLVSDLCLMVTTTLRSLRFSTSYWITICFIMGMKQYWW